MEETFTYDAPLFDRGYTGHEHLYAFGLINMNGRMYDPLTSSFLSPDNYVQDPTSQQGFNRYAYCFYNPLKYTDPAGERAYGPAWYEIMKAEEEYVKQERYNAYMCGMNNLGYHDTYEMMFFNSICMWGDNGPANTGGGHDNSGTGNNGGINLSKLSESQRKSFREANNLICDLSATYNIIFNAVNDCGKDIYIEIDEDLECPGFFDEKNNTITYRSESDMVDFYTGAEEIIHAYQKAVNGSLYSDDLDFNYEFEAKVIRLYVGFDVPGQFAAVEGMIEYSNYISGLLVFGNNGTMTSDKFTIDYIKYANEFMMTHLNSGSTDKTYIMPTHQNPKSIISLNLFGLW